MYALTASRPRCVARERAAAYGLARSPVEAAVAKIEEGLAELAAAQPEAEATVDLGAAVLAVGAAASRLTSQEARLLR